ncbi:MAG: 6-phosphogluconolactonase [Pseudomonadota bacterium]
MAMRHDYVSREDLAEALAISVSGVLAGGIATRGSAVLVVSGGSTPAKFFNQLSQCELEWNKVTIILVDERIVPPDHDRANAKLVAEKLLINRAADAQFAPFIVDGATPEDCAIKSSAQLEQLTRHIDVLILGMGTDGHTASFFPGGDNLNAALDLGTKASVIPMRADGAGEPRLTLTLPAVLSAHFLALHIEGAEKQSVLEQALSGDDVNQMPIRAVFQNTKKPIQIFWAS